MPYNKIQDGETHRCGGWVTFSIYCKTMRKPLHCDLQRWRMAMETKKAGMRRVNVRTPTVCIQSQSIIKSFPNLLKLLAYTRLYYWGNLMKGI